MNSGRQNSFFYVPAMLNVGGRLVDLRSPKVMGILNVTPDSFFDGGKYESEGAILDHTRQMLEEGATFIDVGAYSTRPGAGDVSHDEELKRAVNAIRSIVREFPSAIVSIDTFRSEVAKAAVNEGAAMINDISAGELDMLLPATASNLNVPYVAMHMRGNPATMKQLSQYSNLVKEVVDYFHRKLELFNNLGIKDVIIDPGFGFAKTIEQNFLLLNNLDYLKILGRPILAGLSRKSLIWKTLEQSPEEALNGTTSLNTVALLKGASIIRVHDVKQAVETVKLVTAVQESNLDNR